MKQQVSGPVAAILVFVAVLVFAVLFHNPRLAPPEKFEPPRPPEPTVEDQELTMMRQGLRPLGITAVMAPMSEDRGKGVRVASVNPNSPAGRAGVLVGDRIESFNGQPAVHPMALANMANQSEAGKPATIAVLRNGKKLTLAITGLTPLPPEERPR